MCTAKRVDGHYILKYVDYPRVEAIRERSPADVAGLRVGDQILTVNGRSILSDDALEGTADRNDLRLTVRRDGKESTVYMQSKP